MFYINMVLYVFIVLFSSFAQAEDIKAGVINLSPFGFEDQKEGIYYDMLKAIEAKTKDVKFNIVFSPYPRMPLNFEQDAIDISIYLPKKDSLAVADCAIPVYNYSMLAISKAEHELDTYDDLYKLTSIGVTNGITISEQFDKDAKLKKTPIRDYSNGFEMLILNRLQAIVGTSIGLRYTQLLSKVTPGMLNPKQLVLNKTHACFLVGKNTKHKKIIEEKILPVVKKMVEDNEFDTIVEAFFTKIKTNLIKPKI